MKIHAELKSLTVNAIKKSIKGYLVKILSIILMVVISLWIVFGVISYGASRYSCHTQWQESEIAYKYTVKGGCLVRRGDGWIPAENFRVN